MTSATASQSATGAAPAPPALIGFLASPWLWLVAVWAFLHAAALINAVSPVTAGMLSGPDSYMRLVRIEVLLNGGGWFSDLIARSNAPYGETLHWTRLHDVIILAVSAPLFPFLPAKEALFWGGAFVSPLLHLALGWAVLRAAQTLDPERRLAPAAIVAIGVLVQPAVFNYSLPGRSDHHTLLFLLFALVVWQMLAALRRDTDRPGVHGAMAGLFGAIGIWASPELFTVIAIAAIGLGLGWLFERRSGQKRPGALRANLAFSGVFFLALIPFTYIDHGAAGFGTPRYDEISIVSVFAAAAIFGGWLLIAGVRSFLPDHRVARLILSAVCGGGVAVAIYLVYPGFFAGSMADVDPRIAGFWLSKVQEMRPIALGTAKGLATFVNFLGLALIALPVLAWNFRKTEETRRLSTAIAMGIVLMLVASVLHTRFAPYAEIVAGIGLVMLVARMLMLRAAAASILTRTVAPVAGILAVFVFPFVAGNALDPERTTQRKTASAASATGCDIRAMSAWLANRYREPVTVLAMLDRGPAILWFTHHRVIATPYHRNHDGILALRHVFSAADDGRAKAIVDMRDVDLLLLCPNASEKAFAAKSGSTLYKRIVAGSGPAWLKRVALPEKLAAFRLFSVTR